MRQRTWINALRLEQWAESIAARALLPQLIRRLIHATIGGDVIQCLEFPAGEGIQRPGIDGLSEVRTGNSKVPSGRTVWEFGCDVRVKEKADSDFAKRKADREATFIFVTPRKWTKKKEWSVEKRRLGRWGDVRAYDSADLEEWLELAPAVDLWLANELAIKPKGASDLATELRNLRDASNLPAVTPVTQASDDAIAAFVAWSRREPSQFVVDVNAGISLLGFLDAVLSRIDDSTKSAIAARAVVIEDRHAWRSLAGSSARLILIAHSELELAPAHVAEAIRHGHHVMVSASRPLPIAVETPASAEKALPPAITKRFNEADALIAGDRFTDAVPVLRKALATAQRSKHQAAEAEALVRLGYALMESDSAASEELYRHAIRLVSEHPSRMRHSVLMGLGDLLLRSGRLDEARATLQMALEIARSVGTRGLIARALGSMSILERTLGMTSSARTLLEEAIQLLQREALGLDGKARQRNASALAQCYANQAQLEQSEGQSDTALGLFAKALELHEVSGDKLNVGKIHLLIGNLHCGNGAFEEGFQSFKRALAIFLEIKSSLWMARVFESFARLYAQHANWEEATKAALAAKDGFEEAGHVSEQVGSLLSLARLLAKLVEWDLRRGIRRQIHNLSKSLPKDQGAEVMAGITAEIPRLHDEIDQRVREDSAVRGFLNEATAIAKAKGLHEELADCLIAQADFTAEGKGDEAYRTLIQEAIDALTKALGAATAPKHRGHLMGRLSVLLRDLNRHAEAVMWLNRAGEVCEKAGDIWGLANFYGSMAKVHRAERRLDDEITCYRTILNLLAGRSFHGLAAVARIRLADALRFREEYAEALALLVDAEAICEKHQLKELVDEIAQIRGRVQAELDARQAPSHTVQQLLRSLQQLLRYRSEKALAYLAFWYSAWKAELVAAVRSGPRLSVMVVTDDVGRFMDFAGSFGHVAYHFLMATTAAPTISADEGILPIPAKWLFPRTFQFLFTKKSDMSDGGSPGAEDAVPEVHLSGPATMLPAYMFVDTGTEIDGEGHMMPLTSMLLPQPAIDLMLGRSIKELIRRRALWFPTPRWKSKDPFLTDLRVGSERGVVPVYFDHVPTSDAVAACGAIRVSVWPSHEDANHSTADRFARGLLKIAGMTKAEAKAALLDLPDFVGRDGATEVSSYMEVHLFEFRNVDRVLVHPVLLLQSRSGMS